MTGASRTFVRLLILSTLAVAIGMLGFPGAAYAAPACGPGGVLISKSDANWSGVSASAPSNATQACVLSDSSGNNAVTVEFYDQSDSRISTQITAPTPVGGVTANIDKDGKLTRAPQTTGCGSVLMFMASPFTCGFRAIITLLAGSLIYISTWILAAAGTLFNWLIDHTIIQFGTFYGTIKTAVETAWTAFRDVANILIIGIFTFIAISIILGLKEYGQKKLIAKVLIIAVLINFSLLFTKMIIDASNYSAAQIYTAAALGGSTNTQGNAAGAASTGTKYGLADQFVNLLGVQTFGKALKLVDDTAQAKDSGWIALLHGLLVMVVVLGAAMVLFYGCFLLVSRMIMLIFLMGTASIAFASYLIPKWSDGRFGWKAWWDSLIWCAAFAPILMLLLWMTLNVSYALKGAPGASKATLGAALSDPTGGGNIEALFMYVMILGLLFGTFKISNMWAGKIGGFSYAQMVPGIGVGLGGIAGGFLARNSAGWAARLARDTMKARGWTGKAGNEGLMGTARRQAQIAATRLANRTARTNFNPLQAKTLGIGGKIASTLSVPKVLTGKDVGGSFEDVMKRKAAKADELARQIGPSDTQHRDTAEREARRRHRETSTQLNALIGQQEAMTNTVRQRQNDRPEAEDALRTAQGALDTERRAQASAAEKHASDHRIAEQQEGNGLVPAGTAANLRATRATQMQAEEQRIRDAQAEVARHAQVLTEMDADAQRILASDPHFNELTASIADNTKALESLGRSADDAATRARRDAVRSGTVNLAKDLLWDKRAEYKVESAEKEHGRRQFAADLSAVIKESAPHEEHAASAPAAPATPHNP